MPSPCGMLVYRDLTSIVRRIISEGRLWLSWNIRFRNSVELMDGMLPTRGFKKWSAYFDNLTVGPSQPEMIGLPGMPDL